MEYALGFIAGVVFCIFVAVILVLFRRTVEQHIEITGRAIENASPFRPRGFVFEPESDAEVVRRTVIEENAAQGKDTPISELQ